MHPLYIDNHLLIINKPSGMPTQTHQGGSSSAHDVWKQWLKKKLNKIGNVFLEPVHRLDQPVSGLVLFARTSKALSRMNAQMREKRIIKTYFAVVEGSLPQTEGILEHYLLHDSHFARVTDPSHSGSKKAVLKYKVIFSKPPKSVIEVTLISGRYHQIRAQLAAVGCPIQGDKKYGSALDYLLPGIALHHGRIEFNHPVTKESICIQTSEEYTRFI